MKLKDAEIEAMRRLLAKHDDLDADEGEYEEPEYLDYDAATDEEIARASAHQEWNREQQRRIAAIQECLRRGSHRTQSSESTPQRKRPGQLLVTLACACGAHRRVLIGVKTKPPAEWT